MSIFGASASGFIRLIKVWPDSLRLRDRQQLFIAWERTIFLLAE
jgi:hypothetical protein